MQVNAKTGAISQLHQVLGNFQPQENFTVVQIKFILLFYLRHNFSLYGLVSKT